MMWSAGERGRTVRLTVQSYDARVGLSDDQRYSQTTEDASTLTTPWGHGHLTPPGTGSSTTSHWSFDV